MDWRTQTIAPPDGPSTGARNGLNTMIVNSPPAEGGSLRQARGWVSPDRSVFVVHGRDLAVQDCFFDFLRSQNLWPMDWEDVVRRTDMAMPYLLDAVIAAIRQAKAVVVLLTPDDVVMLHRTLQRRDDSRAEKVWMSQARPNVLVELGIALAVCRDRVIMIEFGQMRPVSDLQGLNTIHFDGSFGSLQKVVRRLRDRGCDVTELNISQQMLERFAALRVYRRWPT